MNTLELNSHLNTDCSFILGDGIVLSGIIVFLSFDNQVPNYYFVESKDKKRYNHAHFEANKELMKRYCTVIDIQSIKHILKIPAKRSMAKHYFVSFKNYLLRLKISF